MLAEFMQTGSAIDTARRLQRERRFAESRLLWCEALESSPYMLAARLGAGNSCLGTGELEEACAHFNVAVEVHPEHTGGHIGLAKAASLRGDRVDAAMHWHNAWQLQPDKEEFALFHVESLILSREPRYRQALKQYETQIIHVDGGYLRIAKALNEIKDTESERVFLRRLFQHKEAPPDSFRLLRGLVRLLWVNGENESISTVLDVAWERFGCALIDVMVDSTFATPLLPAEALWLGAHENQLLSSNYHDPVQLQSLLARGCLWRGDKSAAKARYENIRSEHFAAEKGLVESLPNGADARAWGIYLESCIESGAFELASDAVKAICEHALGESKCRTDWINLLLTISHLSVINGPQQVRAVSSELSDQFLSGDECQRQSMLKDDSSLAMMLARLCVQTRLDEQAMLLHGYLCPGDQHWLSFWVNRNKVGRLLRNNHKSWHPVHSSSATTNSVASLSFSTSVPAQCLSSGAIPLFAKFKNEKHRLPAFLEYYRNLGVSHFFLIDNCSSDNACEYLLDQPDVFLWYAEGSLEANGHCSPWINGLIDEFAPAHWCLSVDLDEYLNFVGSDCAGSLRPFTQKLAARGEELLPAFMLDMFPEKVSDIRMPQVNESMHELHPWFDNTYQFLGKNGAPYLQAVGGFRSRMWPGMCNDTLHKTPLFYSANGVRLVNANHDTNGGIPSRHTGVLRHYRFSDDLPSRNAFSDYISKTNTSFLAFESLSTEHKLPDASSLRYESSDQLLELGLLDVW